MAKGSYQFIRKKISSDWKIDGKNFMLNVSIPANSKATIYIPSKENGVITKNANKMEVPRYEKGLCSCGSWFRKLFVYN